MMLSFDPRRFESYARVVLSATTNECGTAYWRWLKIRQGRCAVTSSIFWGMVLRESVRER